MRLFPLTTIHPRTGASRPLTASLLAEACLAPQTPEWRLPLEAIEAPWSASLAVAPAETTAAVEYALRRLMMATTKLRPEVDLAALAPSRARSHLQGLLDLWRSMGEALPEELWSIRHALEVDRFLEPLPVLDRPDPHATTVERMLMQRLAELHGSVPFDDAVPAHQGSLGHLQRNLFAAGVDRRENDGTVTFYGVRDTVEQADFAAAQAQALIEAGAAPQDIAMLATPAGMKHLVRAFDEAGVPLTGYAEPATRDLAGEALLHALLVLGPLQPGMARASLYASPLMPWDAATGNLLAREIMGGNRRGAAAGLTGNAAKLHEALRGGAQSVAQLCFKLDVLAECLTDAAAMRSHAASLRARIRTIKALTADPLDWDTLLRTATCGPATLPDPSRMVEGVALLPADQVPWRNCRHLIVADFAGNNYPSPVTNDPFFLDSELTAIVEATGLAMPGRAQQLKRALDLFRHQLAAASETITFLCPYRDGRGTRLQPTTGLSLVARTVAADVIDLRDTTRWPCAHRQIARRNTGLAIPDKGALTLNRDLLALRRDDDGSVLPQTPSRLEKLLVSPLAWIIAEAGAQDTPWVPDGPDVLIKGNVAHQVLEHLFPVGPVCTADAITDSLDRHLEAAIRNHAPFLLAASWRLERDTLRRDILRAALHWRERLAEEGAEILGTEIRLHGEAHGITLHGKADCILRLADGQVLIVDHKSSGTRARRDRMNTGWDLQLGLYRAMLERPIRSEGDGLKAIPQDVAPGVAYHLLRDGGVLHHGLTSREGSRMEGIETDISAEAIAMLTRRLAEVGAGTIHLNKTGDEEFFRKEAKLTAYALNDSPIVAAFLVGDSQ